VSSTIVAKPLTRPAMVFAILSIIAIVGFAGVSRLVSRYGEQQKALARRLYGKGIEDQKGGRADRAIEDFRSALGYDRTNFQYQLSLARALRDTGRTDEAESYLINLWERTPQDGFVNLALGRLAARQGSVDKAIQYYHNAAYGVWPSNAEVNRRNAQFELVDFLLRRGARDQAEAELIALAAGLPPEPTLRIRVAQMFEQLGKYERALPYYETALQLDRNSTVALEGAGTAAFQLGRYRVAEGYLRRAVAADPQNASSKNLLEISTLLLQMDPFVRHLPARERTRRLISAFELAKQRLDACASANGNQLAPDSPLASLRSDWAQMRGKLSHLTSAEGETSDAAMDLISQIEQETQKECGPPTTSDRALLLLAASRQDADQ
jgi:tetratricopeptide (TPR) repeat protein